MSAPQLNNSIVHTNFTHMRRPYDPEIAKTKQHNAKVFRETTAIIRDGYYITPSGQRIGLDLQRMIDGGVCSHQELPRVDAPRVE